MCYTVGAGYRLPGYPCDFCEKTSNMVAISKEGPIKTEELFISILMLFDAPDWTRTTKLREVRAKDEFKEG